MRAYLIVALLLLTIFGGISAYLYRQFSQMEAQAGDQPAVTVTADTASSGRWDARLEAVGTIKARRGINLSTEESGEITNILVESGQPVTAGQLLLTLDDKVELASRERHRANLKLAQILFERDEQLVDQKSIPQSQYDRSRTDYDSAVAQLAEIEARLENKRVHAPFDGTLGIIHVKLGDYVSPGTAITTLQDLSDLELDFTVPARYFPLLKPGLDIQVEVSAFPGKTFRATLEAVDSRVEAATRNLLLRARLEPGSGLLPGMFARLTIDLAQPSEVVLVPETAVTYSLHGDTVWIIHKEDGRDVVSSRIVRTGESRSGKIAILEGLSAGEVIVTSGQNKLYRDAVVDIQAQWENIR